MPTFRMTRPRALRELPDEVTVIVLVAFSVALGFGIVAPAIPLFAREFGVSTVAATAVVSAFAVMRLVSAAPAGWAIGRIGERRILSLGLGIVALSSLAAALSQSYPQLLVLRGIGGIGSTMFTVAAMALLLRVVRARQRGRAASAFQAGFLLGGVLGPAVGGAVIGLSIRAPFIVYAVTLGIATLVAWRLLPDPTPEPTTPLVAAEASGPRPDSDPGAASTPSPGPDHTDTDTDTDSAANSSTTPTTPGLAEALRNRSFLAAMAANLTQGYVSFGLRFALVPLFVVEGLGLSDQWTGLAFLIAAAGQVAFLPWAGRMTDMTGRRPAMLVGTTGTVAAMSLLAVSTGLSLFLVATVLMGASAALLGSAPAAMAGDVVGRQGQGVVISVFQMTSDLGLIIGPLLAGVVVDIAGFGWAFATGAAVALLALLATALAPETLPEP